jgi:carbon storage regulator
MVSPSSRNERDVLVYEVIPGLEVHLDVLYRTLDMLVLTRKLMEKLFIGDNICITVVRLEGGQVRLGIDAPRDVTVVRAELVPDRPAPRLRSDHRSQPHASPQRPEVRYSPSEARGTDSRRRGRFR